MESLNTQNGDGNLGRGVLNIVRETATSQLSSQKDRATDGLGSLARAVRQSTQSLRDNQQDTVAQYVEQAADRIEQFSSQLRDRDLGELMREADRFARRQPAIFIGAAFMLGVLAARFFKSSSSSADHTPSFGQASHVGARATSPAARPDSYTPTTRSSTEGF